MADENVLDYGSINLPTKWEELTLKQFQEIERYYSEHEGNFKITDIIHIMCGKPVDEINEMPLEFLDIISEKLSFMTTPMESATPTKEVEINGEKYVIHSEEQLKVGEYVAADTILKSDSHNYAALMAILCRKEGEVYDSKFENEELMKRIEMWEKQPVINVMGIIAFFLTCYAISVTPTLLSSEVEEAISLTRNSIENSAKNGEISRRCMKSAMKKLDKLQQSINSI